MEAMEFDVMIVGSGPAGLTAAIYAQRLGLASVVFGDTPGGNMYMIENLMNYPGFPGGAAGTQVGTQMFAQAAQEGAFCPMSMLRRLKTDGEGFLGETAVEQWFRARTAILAMGVVPKPINVPGADKLATHHCALCDGPLYKGRNATLVIVGGGNMAAHEALILSKFADNIRMVHRRGELRAEEALQKELRSRENVEILYDVEVEEILGEGKASGVKVRGKTGEESVLCADGVFVCVGWQPDLQAIEIPLKTTEEGFVQTDDRLMSSQPGLFAAGDIRDTPLRQVITACADGARAAANAYDYLKSEGVKS